MRTTTLARLFEHLERRRRRGARSCSRRALQVFAWPTRRRAIPASSPSPRSRAAGSRASSLGVKHALLPRRRARRPTIRSSSRPRRAARPRVKLAEELTTADWIPFVQTWRNKRVQYPKAVPALDVRGRGRARVAIGGDGHARERRGRLDRDRLGAASSASRRHPLRGLRLLARGARGAHLRDDRRPRRAQLLPEGLARAEAARVELGLPLPAALGRDRGQRAAEAARDREARAPPRLAARQQGRPARPRVQAGHRRHARGAVDRAREPAAGRGRRRPRLGSGRRRRRAAEGRRRRRVACSTRSRVPTRR